MLDGPTAEEMRDLLLELCLTHLARLCSLFPDHLPRLMKHLVMCLNGSYELVSLGLRTLGPAPYPWGGKALQLLRKLGSRNRQCLKEPLAFECKENPKHGLRLILTFESETPFLLDLPERATDDGLISRHLSTVLVSSVDWSWRKSEASDVQIPQEMLSYLRCEEMFSSMFPGTITHETSLLKPHQNHDRSARPKVARSDSIICHDGGHKEETNNAVAEARIKWLSIKISGLGSYLK
ncbi:transformation/transcription domain-associated protein-like protein isoform X2 [Tanacetum coccineum]